MFTYPCQKTVCNILMFIILALTAVTTSAIARDIATPFQSEGFDINGDGRITMPEIMQHIRPTVQKGFDALDRNRDGAISQDDFSDVSEGMKQMENWLNDLLRPFMPSEKPSYEETVGKTQVF